MKKILSQAELFISGVVANNRMNRARRCTGTNSYQKDLSFDLLEFLQNRLVQFAERNRSASRQISAQTIAAENKEKEENNEVTIETVAWLDICCGEGRALIEATAFFDDFFAFSRENHRAFQTPLPNLKITGIDLAGMFCDFPERTNNLQLLETAIEDFSPAQKFDLITCVHGLHYIGDKLSVIKKCAGWLKEDGKFLANLDLKNIKSVDEKNADRKIASFLRSQGFIIDRRKKLLIYDSKVPWEKSFDFPFQYVGADDQAGPNYTGQPVVDSFYKFIG